MGFLADLYNDEIVNMVTKAGYKTATTVRKGRVNDKENLLELPRVAIRNRAISNKQKEINFLYCIEVFA
jgi:hypothetical protein